MKIDSQDKARDRLKINHLLPLGLIIIAAACLLLPSPWNISPIGGIALFSGAVLSWNKTWLKPWAAPLGAVLAKDLVIGFYNPLLMASVYLGFILQTWIGRRLLAKQRSVGRGALAVGCGALVFFALTNFVVWVRDYPLTVSGFIDCYLRALPFLARSICGDALFTALIFAAWVLGQRVLKVRQVQQSKI